jgi:O-antigen ligase
VAIAAGFLVAAVVLYPTFIESRLNITAGSNSATAYALQAQSDAGRLAALLAGPQLFLTSPVFGIGLGHYSALSAQFTGPGLSLEAHNWYISVLAEEGTAGIVMWALLLVALVIALRSRPRLPQSIGFGVLGAYAVGSLFLEAPTSFQTSAVPILAIVAALAADWTTPSAAMEPATSLDRKRPLHAVSDAVTRSRLGS